ncbi:shikimate 5-dehydrogenase, partial [Streptomyces sp. SID10244]|nr:shikimate 5-dehydrogenase [Streptomyces sp. SID10244]
DDVTVIARNAGAGAALAERYGYAYTADEPRSETSVLVNVTPLGMHGADEDALSFGGDRIVAADVVFDVVAFPS